MEKIRAEEKKSGSHNMIDFPRTDINNMNKISRKGINPIVSSVAVIGIILVSSILVTSVLTPVMKQGEESQTYNEAKQKISSLDALVNELFYEAPGATRVVKVDIEKGKFVISGDENKLKYVLDARIFEPVTKFKEGNVIVSTGPFVKAYESDIDGNGVTDLVLENDDLLFAVRKYGNSTNYTDINTSSLVTLIRNKRMGADIKPKSALYVNDTNDAGNGYTALTVQGSDLTSAGIRLFMNATIDYEAIFTLDAGADFVNLEVRIR